MLYNCRNKAAAAILLAIAGQRRNLFVATHGQPEPAPPAPLWPSSSARLLCPVRARGPPRSSGSSAGCTGIRPCSCATATYLNNPGLDANGLRLCHYEFSHGTKTTKPLPECIDGRGSLSSTSSERLRRGLSWLKHGSFPEELNKWRRNRYTGHSCDWENFFVIAG